jgi:hypothetical protein
MRGVFTRTPPGRRHASRERRRLRCLTLLVGTTANGQRPTAHVRAAMPRTSNCAPPSRVPGERSETRDPGLHKWIALRDSCAGSRISFRSRKRARCTRPGHESAADPLSAHISDSTPSARKCRRMRSTCSTKRARCRRRPGRARAECRAAPRHAYCRRRGYPSTPAPCIFPVIYNGARGTAPLACCCREHMALRTFPLGPGSRSARASALAALVRDTRAGQLRGASRCRVPAERASARAGTQGRHDALLPSAYGIAECGDDMRYGLIGVSGRYPGR